MSELARPIPARSPTRLALFSLVLVAGAAYLGWSQYQRSQQQPNVLFVVLDAVRSDHTSLCGYHRPTTPQLERLVEQGAWTSCDGIAPGSWTLPSHASFFTGLDVVEHGAHLPRGAGGLALPIFEDDNMVAPLGAGPTTLAEAMKAQGYLTLSVSGNPVVTKYTGLTRGFDHAYAPENFGDMHGQDLMDTVRHALSYHAGDTDQPLFLFVNIAEAHRPWTDIPPGLDWLPPRDGLRVYYGGEDATWDRFVSQQMDEDEAKDLLGRVADLYDFGIWRADKMLGDILELWTERGWDWPRWRLVVVSDHGEFLGERGLLDHGMYLWESNNRVPMLVWESDREHGFPTPFPTEELFHVVQGLPVEAPEHARAFAYPSERWQRRSGGRVGQHASVGLWQGDDKLLWTDGDVVRYDLSADPDEQAPLPAEDHPALPSLLEQVERYQQAAPAPPPSREVIEQLRAAGYLD